MISIASGKVKALVSNISVIGATNASPIVVQSSAPHLLETGDVLYCSGANGNAAMNGNLWVATVVDATHFSLQNSNGSGTWISGGIFQHVGFAAGPVTVDNTVYSASNPSWSLSVSFTALTAGSDVRAHLQDSASGTWTDALPGPTVGFAGPLNGLKEFSADWKQFAMNFGNSGNAARLLVLITGGSGSSATFSASLS